MSYLRRLIDKFLAPSHWLNFFLNFIAMLIALEVSEAVLVRNLRDNVYPMGADSIGISLMGMMFEDIGALFILLFVMRLAQQGRVSGSGAVCSDYWPGGISSRVSIGQIYGITKSESRKRVSGFRPC